MKSKNIHKFSTFSPSSYILPCSTDYGDWKFCLNSDYDIVFRNPTTGGELIYKIWSINSKGSQKFCGVKGTWYEINDHKLIVSYKNFDPTSAACKEDFKTTWEGAKGEGKKQKGISYSIHVNLYYHNLCSYLYSLDS